MLIVGRFKAGKSSFINHFIGRALLPVGVIPVTAVVTEIRFGPAEGAEVRFLDGTVKELRLNEIGGYISERENAENRKGAAVVKVELPGLKGLQRLAFVDTPGLESVLAHDMDASMHWLPNVGLALIAVSVDPPPSQHDVDLLRNLSRYTPNISILLTRADLLTPEELTEVVGFVRAQLAKSFDKPPEIFPYSIRPGYGHLKARLEQGVILETLRRFDEQRRAICVRKIDTLLRECSDYVTLSLKSAELAASGREAMKAMAAGEKEAATEM